MAGFWRKALIYLGLVEEEDELEPLPPQPGTSTPPLESVRTIGGQEPASVRPVRGGEQPSHVSPIGGLSSAGAAPQVSMHVVEPRSFNDAKEIADRLKVNSPVIMNLQHVDKELGRRLVDFASGLTYMADGTIRMLGERIFLLTPQNVEVSAEEARELMSDRGFFNQM